MFIVDYSLEIRHDTIGLCRGHADVTPEVVKGDFHKDGWTVTFSENRRVIIIKINEGEEDVTKKLLRPFTGTLLLGSDSGIKEIVTVPDDALCQLINDFQITEVIHSEPNATYDTTWRSPYNSYDGTYNVYAIATDGISERSATDEELVSCRDAAVYFTVANAKWVVCCNEIRDGDGSRRVVTLTTLEDPLSLTKELGRWLAVHEMDSFADMLELWL